MNRILMALLLLGSGTLSFAQNDQKATAEKRREYEEQARKEEAEAQAERARAIAGEKDATVVLVHLKYADPEIVRQLLSQAGVNLRSDRTLHLLVLTGEPDRVTLAQKVIQDIDVPSSAGIMLAGPPVSAGDLEFTVYLLAGLNKAEESTGAPATSAWRTKALEGTVSQLRAIFPFASYRLLDTAVLRVNGNSSGEVGGILPPLGEGGDALNYEIDTQVRGIVPKEHESQISVPQFRFSLRLPKGGDVSVRTALEMREGEQVVVGKAGMGAAGTLFVVVSARVLK
jgi:hypothetical protein